jgi:hypothetical protein
MRFIGLRGANTREVPLGTGDKMTEGLLGYAESTAGFIGLAN